VSAGESRESGAERPGRTLALAVRALRHRNFRLFTAGQTVSLIGTWMQQVAVGWLVYRLTDSAFLLGLVGFVSQAPVFVLAPIAGAVADRVNRHRIVIVTQSLMMVQALALALLVLTGSIDVWQIVALMAFLGAVTGFDIPARQSFLLEMVGSREDLANAIALNSSMFNAARLIGPAIAGFAISIAGEGRVILINGVSYIGVLGALLAMDIRPRERSRDTAPVLRHIREGFDYAFGFHPIRAILTLVAVVSVTAVPFSVLLPVIATDVLGGDARTLGFLMSATGLGALAGALFLASRRTVRGLGRVILGAALLFGTALVVVALSRALALTMLLLAFAGFGMMVQMAASNTVLQTIVDDDKRGRIMSLYSMAYIGTTPIGSLLAGIAASHFGTPATLAVGGGVCMLAALVFGYRLPRLREMVVPIYTRLGIIPEVAGGIQAATHLTTPQVRRQPDGPEPRDPPISARHTGL
jgi:MFS family permease